MPQCCPSSIIPFFDEPVTVIPYTTAMQSAYGPEPHVSIYYMDSETGKWYTLSGIMGTEVKFDPTANLIYIDHGGVFTGFTKID